MTDSSQLRTPFCKPRGAVITATLKGCGNEECKAPQHRCWYHWPLTSPLSLAPTLLRQWTAEQFLESGECKGAPTGESKDQNGKWCGNIH